MFSSAQDEECRLPQPEGNLEHRLRELILRNANSPSDMDIRPHAMQTLPPHMLMATPEEQQGYLARVAARSESTDVSIPPGKQPSAGRKKPNQAQRRQMNSQLSIPINPRASQSTKPVRDPVGAAQQSWPEQLHNGYPQAQYDQRYIPQPPQFHQPSSTYSPHGNYSQGPQPSPRHQYQPGNQHQYHPRQSPNFQQQYHQEHPFAAEQAYPRPPPQNRQLFQPGSYSGQGRGRPFVPHPEEISNQCAYLTQLLEECVSNVAIEPEEEAEKETFRAVVEKACRDSIVEYEQQELGNSKFDPSTVSLACFGSMSSGFATKASDMDLALLTPHSKPAADSPESRIPRLLEKKLLELGYGARLLTRTRVPIIKLCEKPTEKLRADLLEERTKWENGFIDGQADEEDRTQDVENPTEARMMPNDGILASSLSRTAESAPHKPKTECDEDHQGQLKQKCNQTLGEYYNSAKRTLRKLGGLDLSASGPEPNPEQLKILNVVCKAFISGLSSAALSMQLRSYKSISPLFNDSQETLQRSLNGIWIQVEGERLALSFENRILREASDRYESGCSEAVEAWRQLQDECGPPTETFLFNRQLYMACENLKRFSSLRLVSLEQLQHEEPSYYAAKAQKIMTDLRNRPQEAVDTITPIVIAHYVSGICNPRIREAMHPLTESQPSWTEVVKEHRILQLAIDYDHALEKGLYADEDRPCIEQYVAFLRDRSTTSLILGAENLLAKIRSLPDPTEISLNKPRDRYKDHLEFPKTNVGIQCDINFSAHLALHNTLLLRCYSHSDPRVKLLILFVKHWAKARGINTPYRGTLSSYGYVLMVLHYLTNIAYPFVCPNLQALHREPPPYLPPAEIEARTTCSGRDVRFWRNEEEIKDLANRGLLNHNRDSIGVLVRGFFEYFAQSGQMTTVQNRGFDWGREVLSLRTQGGIVSKQEKGWTGAKTVIETTTVAAPPTPSTPAMKISSAKDQSEDGNTAVAGGGAEVKTTRLPLKTMEETKEIRHRYLFAIEDPFELDHNVARTVTHNGIVSIRDEFRRAWRIIKSIGKAAPHHEHLLDPVSSSNNNKGGLQELFDLIHGPQQTNDRQQMKAGGHGVVF